MIIGVHQSGAGVTVMGDLRSIHMQRIRDAGARVVDVNWEPRLDRKTLRLIREAIDFHIEGLKEDGLPVPEPCSETEVVETTAA